MNLNKGGKGSYEKPNTGSVIAVCFRVIELGTQKQEYKGDVKHLPKVLVSWEINQKRKDGKRFVMSKSYTESLHEKSRLRIDLESWRGKKFTDDELAEFNETKMLGKPCLLTLVESKDGQYVNIGGISPMVQGMEAFELENMQAKLGLDEEHFNQSVFDGLNDKVKAKIMLSPEWAKLKGVSSEPHDEEPPQEEETPF